MEKETFNVPEVEIIRYDEEALMTSTTDASIIGTLPGDLQCGIDEE